MARCAWVVGTMLSILQRRDGTTHVVTLSTIYDAKQLRFLFNRGHASVPHQPHLPTLPELNWRERYPTPSLRGIKAGIAAFLHSGEYSLGSTAMSVLSHHPSRKRFMRWDTMQSPSPSSKHTAMTSASDPESRTTSTSTFLPPSDLL